MPTQLSLCVAWVSLPSAGHITPYLADSCTKVNTVMEHLCQATGEL